MTAELNTARTNLEARLTHLCGFPVEVTFRSEKSFTFSAEGQVNLRKAIRHTDLAGCVTNVEQRYDAECDLTCLYFDVK